MNDNSEKRRSKKLRVSSEEENMEKLLVHREVEKLRRQEMTSLYASLRCLLPLKFLQGKRSTSDQVNGAVNYIEYLQRNIKDMNVKRDKLVLLSERSFMSTSIDKLGCNEMSNHVVMRPCLVGLEIVFSVSQTPFSSVLKVLHEKGLCVFGCISSTVNGRLIHTLQAEVNDLAMTDLEDLTETLNLMK